MGIKNEEIKFRVSLEEKEAIHSLCLRNEKLSTSIRKILLEKANEFKSSEKRKIAAYNSERLVIREEINKLELKIRVLEHEDEILKEKIENLVEMMNK
jgi:hypothetical protein